MFSSLFLVIYWIYFVSIIECKESLHIMEDLAIGTAIYTFSTNSCKTLNHTGTYRFVDSQKNSNDFFLIDHHTGRITTKKLIDRDDFCLRRMCSCSNCQITLEVLCVNQGEIFFNDLIITIDDQNDHSPQFPKSSLNIDVLENVPIGYLIPIDIAIDLDYGLNSIQGYELFENNSINKIHQAFQLEYSKATDLLALRLVKLLDRESYQTLNYLIQAYDGGQVQAHFGYLNITINILDVNDMSPMFDRSEIHVLLSESTSIGSLVAHVHAYDRDTGANGLVYYTIVSLDPPSNETFFLSKETGEIRLSKRLDYEKEKSYRIKIKAQDNGPQQGSMPTFALVHIEIKDENDNYPLITSTFNNDSNLGVEHSFNSSQIRIKENLPNGTFLGHISINDLDEGNNGRISWSLESHQSISIKKLFHNEAFLMFTSKIFDREQQSQYNIYLQTFDHGQPSLSNQLNFSLIIIDENDNEPKFDRDFYSINISENTLINTKIFQFQATDADEENTLNSQIEYHLNNHSFFSLNPLTGELYLIKQLDREEKSSYELKITASDHGQPQSLSTTVHCSINIIDVNDNHPQFDRTQYIFSIAETWSKDIPIGHFHATDADEYDRELTYTLVHNETTMRDKWPFELTSNGTLYLKRTSDIDYEQRSYYQFQIIAFDIDRLNTSVDVIVYIENRNDFCPELLFNSTVLFFNIDLELNNSLNQYDFHLFDGDQDSCRIDLLNFQHLFQLEQISLNFYRFIVHHLPEREYYILQFRLYDLINQTNENDESCQKDIQLILTIGTNQTNQTWAIETAREYFDALHLISKRNYSYFDLTILNVIIFIVFLSIAIVIALISLKFISSNKNSSQQTNRIIKYQESTTLYRLQGPTETQLPLLANEPIEQSFISIDQQQQAIDSINSKDLQSSTYDYLGNFSTENPYETNQIMSSNYYSSPRVTQTLKTFSHIRLAEQEDIIDV